ncbi:hydrolase [Sphingobium jiangsuense]|uniref:2-keto-4-pentenoate hydratase/2-oxohepta-3-ene-1,7-dioic acid hydratase in catechol pathway n=1 Tax=Sphingobium jiangsuense TaxID=870476 RepID=A0A7W6BKJ5_9SPHN|nr:fumarylacetoacetate hydrolase family protein [Sphingobium jiangsuense]MBB3924428.1 2-keto-4-pentenoate hydratase/2-oxohepta-3-ene-1,7-dioic acid hydratase in catechol pathway [Sphingobium jiangsuense]GLT02469.1 hydrolase [Sphingobium jiangsuense]
MTEFNAATGLASGSFGIGTYAVPGEAPFPGIVLPDGTVLDLSDRWRDTHAIFDDWDRSFDALVDIAAKRAGRQLDFPALRALPCVAHPNMLFTGSNYRQHVAEMMTHNRFNQHNRKPGESDEDFFQRNYAEIDRRAREGMPYFWTSLHSALAGANDDIPLPLVGEHPDWELELGVIVGKTGRYVRPEEAGDLIAGYVMVNDLGTVDEFRRTDVRFMYDWVSKHQPNFKPLGPFIVPRQFVDFSRIRIELKLNGQVMQDWPVTDMIFSPEQILSYASERIRLLPGDLLSTGSPPGNGAFHGNRWLKPGDVIESELTFLGRQRNHVVAEETHGRGWNWGPFPVDETA